MVNTVPRIIFDEIDLRFFIFGVLVLFMAVIIDSNFPLHKFLKNDIFFVVIAGGAGNLW